jgi:protein-S-isoprenylcysteine O-methyltransferase Ste14
MNHKEIHDIKSYILVTIQFGCLAGLLLTGPLLTLNLMEICIGFLSVLLGIWAVVSMHKSKLSVFPTLKEGAVIITNGPYRFIRHPMYLAVIFFALSMLLENMSLIRIAIWVLLVFNLLIKIEFEEKILCKEFKEYEKYSIKTRKLLPFIY